MPLSYLFLFREKPSLASSVPFSFTSLSSDSCLCTITRQCQYGHPNTTLGMGGVIMAQQQVTEFEVVTYIALLPETSIIMGVAGNICSFCGYMASMCSSEHNKLTTDRSNQFSYQGMVKLIGT